jgi:hypothetical protein
MIRAMPAWGGRVACFAPSPRRERPVRSGGVPRELGHGRSDSTRLRAFRCARSRAGALRPWPPRNRHGSFLRNASLYRLRRHHLSHRGRPTPSGAPIPCSMCSETTSPSSRRSTMRATRRSWANSASRGSPAWRHAFLPAVTIVRALPASDARIPLGGSRACAAGALNAGTSISGLFRAAAFTCVRPAARSGPSSSPSPHFSHGWPQIKLGREPMLWG